MTAGRTDCPFGSEICPKVENLKVDVTEELKGLRLELGDLRKQLKTVGCGLYLICLFLAATFGLDFISLVIP